MIIKGKIWKFGDNLQGDYHVVPYPIVREIFDTRELSKYCMINVDSEFPDKVSPGDILVAGKRFGCGVCHPHGLMALSGLQLSLVIADSIANESTIIHALHEALPIYEAPGITNLVEQGDEVEVNLRTGVVKNITTGKEQNYKPLATPILERLEAGGLIPFIRQKMQELSIGT